MLLIVVLGVASSVVTVVVISQKDFNVELTFESINIISTNATPAMAARVIVIKFK